MTGVQTCALPICKHPHQEFIQIDTTNVLFIVGGAFAGLDSIVEQRLGQKRLGFTFDLVDGERVEDERDPDDIFSHVMPEDLLKFGMIPEFIGRLPMVGAVHALDRPALASHAWYFTSPPPCSKCACHASSNSVRIISAGLPATWDVAQTEMYGEPFHVPPPDEVVFEEKWDKGEHFRSGCVWRVGQGRVFYFRPGHETFPVFKQAEPLLVVENAVRWLGTK